MRVAAIALLVGFILGLWAGGADMTSDWFAGLVSATVGFLVFAAVLGVTDRWSDD